MRRRKTAWAGAQGDQRPARKRARGLKGARRTTPVVEAVAAGATGYLQKETGLDRLLAVVRGVAQGEIHVPAEVVRRVFRGMRSRETGDAVRDAGLTTREREILIAFARGMSYSRIAEERGIRPVTVRNAVYGIQQKLNIASMQELVLWAARNGLTEG